MNETKTGMQPTLSRTSWFVSPPFLSTVLFLVLVIVIAPWGEFPINDDWMWAHIAKNLAERGVLAIDLQSTTSIIGQAILAWPIIHFFGFSFLKLRLLSLAISILIIFEIDYLLKLADAGRKVRLFTLCMLVVNPFFIYFSTSFMTEHYSLAVSLLSACVWFKGRKTENIPLLILAAAIGGFAFWIRQLNALVYPALLLAEFMGKGRPATRRAFVARSIGVIVWLAIVLSFFLWARWNSSQTEQASKALSRLASPDPVILFFQLGIFVYYVTFFVAPFLIARLRRENPSIRALLIPSLLILSAGFALFLGDTDGSPRSNIHRTFPFLHNVFNQYGVGPILVTDVYIENSGVRPHSPAFPWITIQILLVVLSVTWGRVLGALRTKKHEIAFFGVCFALLNYLAVGMSFQTAIFDRYHYIGIIGFTIALAAILPENTSAWFARAATVWIIVLGIFSTLALHDHFRWQEARAELAKKAETMGIARSQIDAGYEINGWNDIEKLGASPDCGYKQFWFCGTRPYRIGTTRYPTDQILVAQPIRWWLLPFPDMLLLKRGPMDQRFKTERMFEGSSVQTRTRFARSSSH